MKLIIIINLLLIFFINKNLFAQDNQNNNLGFSTGYSFISKQDLVYSHFRHSGISTFNYRIKYRYENDLIHLLESSISANKIERFEPFIMEMGHHSHKTHPHEFVNFKLYYGIGTVINDNNVYKEWIGGSINSDIQAAFYNFVLSEMFGYLIDNSLNVFYNRKYKVHDNHNFIFSLEIPMISWLSRPPYLAEDDKFIENISSHNKSRILFAFIKDGEIAFPNKIQKVNFNFEYHYNLLNNFSFGIDYYFSFTRTTKPKTYLNIINNINFLTTYKF